VSVEDDLFWEYWNEVPAPTVTCAEAREIFTAGVRASDLPGVVLLWQRVRSEVNTPATRKMDELLRKVS
jgi:hypothetical protein